MRQQQHGVEMEKTRRKARNSARSAPPAPEVLIAPSFVPCVGSFPSQLHAAVDASKCIQADTASFNLNVVIGLVGPEKVIDIGTNQFQLLQARYLVVPPTQLCAMA